MKLVKLTRLKRNILNDTGELEEHGVVNIKAELVLWLAPDIDSDGTSFTEVAFPGNEVLVKEPVGVIEALARRARRAKP